VSASDTLDTIRDHSGWFMALGVAQIAVGALAIGSPLVATLASAVFLGWLLLIAGSVQAVQAFRYRVWHGFFLHLAGALLYLLAGVLIVTRPAAGALTLTLILAIFFAVEGISRVMLGMRVRGTPGATGLVIGGALGTVLGLLIWLEWPSSAVWAIGLLLGVNLVVNGIALVSLAMAARRGGEAKAT
jgi:uncharacterized membrane protein HdeD (DUF308 family)